MASSLRVEDKLDGKINVGASKERIVCVFEEAKV